jgi:hypothetical protein
MALNEQPGDTWLTTRALAARYGVAMRSVERWVEMGNFPAPMKLPNGRKYWKRDVIEEHERSLVGAQCPPTAA